jgi:hypothetical protein
MSLAFVSAVKVDDIAGKKPPHASGQGLVACPYQDVKMLCEALDYVKLNISISGLLFHFLHLFNNLLHIIGVLWQAHSTTVRHWVSAMEEVL